MGFNLGGGALGGMLGGVTGGLLGGFGGGLFGGPSTPGAPDYVGAANATAAGNLRNANIATQANRVNQQGPTGNISWQNTGTAENPNWTQTTSLSPQLQGLFNQGAGFNLNNAPANPINPGQTAQQAIMSRLQPQQTQETKALDQTLANQGIGVGSEAYDNAKRVQNQGFNDLNSQAALSGINLDIQNRQNTLNQQLMPIQALQGLQYGSNPNMPGFSQQVTTPGADLTGAANAQYGAGMNQYNAQMGQQNGILGGLFGLGNSALLGSMMKAAPAVAAA